jgi:hypothetical protein
MVIDDERQVAEHHIEQALVNFYKLNFDGRLRYGNSRPTGTSNWTS